MSCEIISSPGAMFVLWGRPTKSDLDRVYTHARELANESQRPIVYITRVPALAPAPEPSVRRHLYSVLGPFSELCSSYHVILEGDGFINAIKRGVLASMVYLVLDPSTFFIHANVGTVISKVEEQRRSDAEAILRLADRQGLLRSAGPSTDQRIER